MANFASLPPFRWLGKLGFEFRGCRELVIAFSGYGKEASFSAMPGETHTLLKRPFLYSPHVFGIDEKGTHPCDDVRPVRNRYTIFVAILVIRLIVLK